MSQTITQEIHVDELSKYGVKVGDEYVNYSKQLKETEKGKLVPGGDYTVEMYVADSGKRYINSVTARPTGRKPKNAGVPSAVDNIKEGGSGAKVAAIPNTEPISNGLSKNEWAQKDRRISRQGCIQAAVIALGPLTGDTDRLFTDAVVLADKMLEFVNS